VTVATLAFAGKSDINIFFLQILKFFIAIATDGAIV